MKQKKKCFLKTSDSDGNKQMFKVTGKACNTISKMKNNTIKVNLCSSEDLEFGGTCYQEVKEPFNENESENEEKENENSEEENENENSEEEENDSDEEENDSDEVEPFVGSIENFVGDNKSNLGELLTKNLILKSLLFTCLFYLLAHKDSKNFILKIIKIEKENYLYLAGLLFLVGYLILNLIV